MYDDYVNYNDNNYFEDDNNNDNKLNKYKKWIFIGLVIICIILLVLVILKFNNNKIDTSKLYFVDTSVYLEKGESFKLSLNKPNNDDYTVEWSIDNENISIDAEGVIYAIKVGKSTVTAIGSDGKTASCVVVVSESSEIIGIESINLDITELELKVGEKYEFNLDINPTNVNVNDEIVWESSNLDVLAIDNETVEALQVGSSVVTVKTKNGKTATCQVTVLEKEEIDSQLEILPSKIKLNINSRILNIGDTLELSVSFEPNDVTNKDIVWESSDPSIASIEDGTVHALKSGIAIITAKTVNDKMSSCTIVVNGS